MTSPGVKAADAPEVENHSSCARKVELADVLRIVEQHRGTRGALIAILEEVQEEYGYLPEAALRLVSQVLERSLVDVYGVATFYSAFSLKPRGRHVVCACLGTACHVRGAPLVVAELERQLRVQSGNTTPSGEFTLQTANCLGACALGPVVVVDGRYHSKVQRSQVSRLVEAARRGVDADATQGTDKLFALAVSCPECRRSLKDEGRVIDGQPSIRLQASSNDRRGSLWLSALYGSARISSEHDLAMHALVELACPHCAADLTDSWTCQRCEAPMARMAIDGGGTVRICRRRGCTSHMLDLA